jgi:hypothetical protein
MVELALTLSYHFTCGGVQIPSPQTRVNLYKMMIREANMAMTLAYYAVLTY